MQELLEASLWCYLIRLFPAALKHIQSLVWKTSEGLKKKIQWGVKYIDTIYYIINIVCHEPLKNKSYLFCIINYLLDKWTLLVLRRHLALFKRSILDILQSSSYLISSTVSSSSSSRVEINTIKVKQIRQISRILLIGTESYCLI